MPLSVYRTGGFIHAGVCPCQCIGLGALYTLVCALVMAFRLEEMVHSVYSERSHLRKTMSDLDAAEREILLRVYRKVR